MFKKENGNFLGRPYLLLERLIQLDVLVQYCRDRGRERLPYLNISVALRRKMEEGVLWFGELKEILKGLRSWRLE